MTNTEQISLINKILGEYFANPKNPRKIKAKELMPLFIEYGVFSEDRQNGWNIRDFLRELDKENSLDSIPFVLAKRKPKYTYWYFTDKEHDNSIRKITKPVKEKNVSEHKRCDSDEYYVIGLCNEALKRTALQQHHFDFLRGDTGKRLPVDAYYEDLNLVVEYYERQHTESVALFDKKQTVSGVDRATQRKIYDNRRREELPKHGIKLVVISYSDFGTSKKLSRHHDSDLEIVKRILKDNLKCLDL